MEENYLLHYDEITGKINGIYLRSIHMNNIPSPTIEISKPIWEVLISNQNKYKVNIDNLILEEIIEQEDISVIRTQKISEFNALCHEKVVAGFTSTAFDGTTEKSYDCKDTDQLTLFGLINLAQLRLANPSITEPIKWKSNDMAECVEWTPQAIINLGLDMKRHIEANINRYDTLKITINNATTISEIKSLIW